MTYTPYLQSYYLAGQQSLPYLTHSILAGALTHIEAGLTTIASPYIQPSGIVANGTTDNTTVLQAAVNQAQASSLPLLLPAGTILTGPLTVAPGNLSVWGPGRENCTLKLKNGSNGYLFTFNPGNSGFITVDFREFGIDGNAAGQSSGGCIYGAGAVQSRFDNLHLQNAYDVCLWLYQNTGGGFGHHNQVTHCLFDNLNSISGATQQGIRMQSCDENYIAFNDFENWGGLAGNPGSEPYAIKDWSGIQTIIANVFVSGQEAIRIQDSASTKVIGNTFDGPGRAGVHASGSKNIIASNLFSNGSSSSNGANAQCEIDNSTSCVVTGNSFTVTTSGQVRNCIYELSSGSTKTVATSNVIDLSGGSLFGGNPAVQLQGAASAARSNPGWNPVGKITSPPAVPGSTTAATNSTGSDATVYVAAGSGVTVSAIAVGGNATGLTVAANGLSSGVRLPAAQTITLTYAGGTPTWTWFGD